MSVLSEQAPIPVVPELESQGCRGKHRPTPCSDATYRATRCLTLSVPACKHADRRHDVPKTTWGWSVKASCSQGLGAPFSEADEIRTSRDHQRPRQETTAGETAQTNSLDQVGHLLASIGTRMLPVIEASPGMRSTVMPSILSQVYCSIGRTIIRATSVMHCISGPGSLNRLDTTRHNIFQPPPISSALSVDLTLFSSPRAGAEAVSIQIYTCEYIAHTVWPIA